MLTKNEEFEAFGFRFSGEHQNEVSGVYSIGWERKSTQDYDYDGMTRNEYGKCVFQYTFSGAGKIDVDGKEYSLTAGQAFLVQIPSKHRYYLPADSEHWEFMFITLYGKEAVKAFDFINSKLGYVIQFNPESSPIKLLMSIFQEAINRNITDAYESSAMAYSFIMELYRYALNIGVSTEKWPEQVEKAILFAKKYYSDQIGLGDLVIASGLSKYHFTRLFHRTTNLTPVQYLTKIRIDKAIELLRMTNHSIDDIARMVGYSTGNYFIKVFNKRIGMSPGQFRESKYTVPVDHIMTD
ncbi:AraC family transcriptional regulator [Bacillus sp. FSL K6-3431]|uniref:AraC family transcriptional regulator n=1 Tax=Bacillus sp. FSL K6-3431 TaxID=2921500 RepID=UPI0030F84784